jgi:probable DNA metabolism protein
MNEFLTDDTFKDLKTAYRAGREIDRIKGFLRFSPNAEGLWIARCAPDHAILPALAEHFTARFGEEPWAIIDEARNCILLREKGEDPRLLPFDPDHPLLSEKIEEKSAGDPWENLWKNYHRVVNNDSRANPKLQKQFLPKRYWKYLPEMDGDA